MQKSSLKAGAAVLLGAALMAGGAVAAPHSGVTPLTPTQDGVGSELQILQQQNRDAALRSFFDRLNLKRQGKGSQSATLIGDTGLAAGDAAMTDKLSLWLSVNYNNLENSFPAIAYDADTYGVSIGVDYAASDTVNAGAFLSYANTDTTTPFNGGGSDTDAFSFGPYVSVMLNDIFTIDASVGYTFSSIDNRRVAGGLTITGDQDAETWFGSVNLSATKWFENNVGLTGRIGYSYSDSDNDAYIESNGTPVAASDSQLGQLQVGVRANYYMDEMMPYLGITYVNDVDSDRVIAAPLPSDDEDEFIANAGVTFFSSDPISGGLDLSYNFGRDDTDGFGVGANIRFAF